MERELRVALVTPPAALAGAALVIATTTSKDLRGLAGHAARAAGRGEPHRLLELMTQRSADGFRPLPEHQQVPVRAALSDLTADELEVRAQRVVRTPAEARERERFRGRVQDERGVPSAAASHCTPVRVSEGGVEGP